MNGDLWRDGSPDWTPVLSRPEARPHLYAKAEPRPGRKMGHVLLLDEDPYRALRTGEEPMESLTPRSPAHSTLAAGSTYTN